MILYFSHCFYTVHNKISKHIKRATIKQLTVNLGRTAQLSPLQLSSLGCSEGTPLPPIPPKKEGGKKRKKKEREERKLVPWRNIKTANQQVFYDRAHSCFCIASGDFEMEPKVYLSLYIFCGAATQRGSWPPHS